MKEKEKCTAMANLGRCELPKIDVKEHRRKVKAYLKEFNKAIEKAIKDDRLVLTIGCSEQMTNEIYSLSDNDIAFEHTISFKDGKFFKLR